MIYPTLNKVLSSEVDEKTHFRYGHCGTYALALHDLSGGKLKLGMIRGERIEGGDDVDVNIHSYVLHPTQSGKFIDVNGIGSIHECAVEWESEQDWDAEPSYIEEEFNSRKDFMKALRETGHPSTMIMYDSAVKMIKESNILGTLGLLR